MEIKELFLTFIKESEKELTAELANPTGEQGNDFHRENYSLLKKEFKKASKLLNAEDLNLFYFHYCRTGLLPLEGLEKTYQIWESAYNKQMIYMDKDKYDYLFSHVVKLKGLLLYGFYYDGEIDKNEGFAAYSKYRNMYEKINSYTNIPGMLKKAAYFSEFSKDILLVNRISKTLTELEFIQDLYWNKKKSKEDYEHNYHYSCVNLIFWGVIFVLVLSEYQIAKNTIEQFKAANYLPRFEEQMEILTRLEKMKK